MAYSTIPVIHAKFRILKLDNFPGVGRVGVGGGENLQFRDHRKFSLITDSSSLKRDLIDGQFSESGVPKPPIFTKLKLTFYIWHILFSSMSIYQCSRTYKTLNFPLLFLDLSKENSSHHY